MSTNKFKTIVLEADSYHKRGQIHGETLRALIIEHQSRWEEDLMKSTGLEADYYLDQLLAETNFMPAIERWTPELLEEVKGIAEGANIDYRYALARQLSDEEPWYRKEKKLSPGEGRNCTSIGLDCTDVRPTIIGQNMDCPSWYEGHQVLFHHKGVDLAADVFSFSMVGKINLCGMNSNGLGICCNTLSKLDYSKNGLPEDFVVRGFLAQESLEAGLAFMHKIKHASGQNYTVAEPGSRAINLEASANKVVEYKLDQQSNYVFHTNHPFVNDEQSIYQKQQASGQFIPGSTNTLERYEDLHQRLVDKSKSLTKEDMKLAFSSHVAPVCRHSGEGVNVKTLGCLIMELTDPPLLHIAPGPPCETDFTTYKF